MEVQFEPDPQVEEAAMAYARQAEEFAAQNFGVQLDMSEASVQEVERMLGQLHDQLEEDEPDEEVLWAVAKSLGSYVGEVLRAHHDWQWGVITMEGEKTPGMARPEGFLCWPWERARKRIVNGPEDNIWRYYQMVSQPAE